MLYSPSVISETLTLFIEVTSPSFESSPSLPSGLSILPDGSIDGTPTKVAERTIYTITATIHSVTYQALLDMTVYYIDKPSNVGVYDTVKEFIEGKLTGGQEKVYGLKEDGVGIPETTKNLVPQDIIDYVNSMIEKIKNDEIKVPSNEEEYKSMQK